MYIISFVPSVKPETAVPARASLPLVPQARATPVPLPRGASRCMEKMIQGGEGEAEEVECGICMEKVMQKRDAKFGLLNCEHAFCLQCIRQWRSNNTLDNQVIRSCPICRTVSHFITPSTVWITDRKEKQRVIAEYKKKLSSISCKHFNQGEGSCPFGTSCFYAHIFKDGTREEIRLRTVVGASETHILSTVRLSDFLEAQEAKRAGRPEP
ncbi:hypothetical protein BC938DRAFT_482342 [Jimgerdemannia flammicorona]|uniref:RING-type E3 ubiquitin transferase n=1 Tax=Jimgerdemannia flammicorona TaxID=994334 RepID=A0A433QE96_9FUNG|nr:hypothetical protein BC938DRAFT_482342 [Jimgerdemannia flammicorona]